MNSQTLAQYLHDLDLVTFDPDGTDGDCFIERLPVSPDAVVCISTLGGTVDRSTNERSTTWQIRTRGIPDDPVGPYETIHAITEALAVIDTPVVMAADSDHAARAILIIPGTPALMGWDENDRAEFVARVVIRYAA